MGLKDKKNIKSKNVFDSFKYAFTGIWTGFKNTRNLWIDFFIFVIVIICGFIFKISVTEWIIVLLCSALVMSLELINTAIETVVDIVSPEYNKLAKISKDVAAGAVLLFAIFTIIIGLIIFVPKLIDML